jgi:hypothetical protein
MAYTVAQILTEASLAYFGTSTPPSDKSAGMTKAIQEAWVEINLLHKPVKPYDQGDYAQRLWRACAMYLAGVTSLGYGHPSVDKARVDYVWLLDQLEKSPHPNSNASLTTPAV